MSLELIKNVLFASSFTRSFASLHIDVKNSFLAYYRMILHTIFWILHASALSKTPQFVAYMMVSWASTKWNRVWICLRMWNESFDGSCKQYLSSKSLLKYFDTSQILFPSISCYKISKTTKIVAHGNLFQGCARNSVKFYAILASTSHEIFEKFFPLMFPSAPFCTPTHPRQLFLNFSCQMQNNFWENGKN